MKLCLELNINALMKLKYFQNSNNSLGEMSVNLKWCHIYTMLNWSFNSLTLRNIYIVFLSHFWKRSEHSFEEYKYICLSKVPIFGFSVIYPAHITLRQMFLSHNWSECRWSGGSPIRRWYHYNHWLFLFFFFSFYRRC